MTRNDTASPLVPTTFSTQHLPGPRQFAAYRDECGGWLDTAPVGDAARHFPMRATAWSLGPLALIASASPPVVNRRTAAHIRRDQMDHWSINVMTGGSLRARIGDADVDMRPGVPHLFALHDANATTRDEAGWTRLFIARDTLPGLAPVLDGLRNRPLPGPLWGLVGDYMQALALRLPSMTEADTPAVVAATRALVAAAAEASTDALHAARPQIDQVMRARILGLIRANLGSCMLGPERLCRMAGVSRSALYRLFEPLGGVARTIQAERLREAHRRLAEAEDRRSIQAIAEGLGFFDPSSFSRAFRQEFGVTPTALRRGAPPVTPATARHTAPRGTLDVLRGLGR
ncbi:helix-turn-helix transcriptional regulator [Humitalea sp. 24SJ18S-53]|uniref:helix-turn-helix transcriptional regulator n=1 Tax=Humitalea sp. 24SJ18S-53 TaxID=3422307 RepID=UPI003D66C065